LGQHKGPPFQGEGGRQKGGIGILIGESKHYHIQQWAKEKKQKSAEGEEFKETPSAYGKIETPE
jgi:hypothetical protein